jgi:copper chaperone CopZ
MMERTNFVIRGMGCGSCVSKVSAALASLPGVVVENVKVGAATVLIDPAKTTSRRLVEAIAAAGFDAQETPTSGNVK